MKKILLFAIIFIAFASFCCAFAEAPVYTGSPSTDVLDASFIQQLSSEGILYRPLDSLKRATGAAGVIGRDTMAASYKQNAQNIKPTGWVQERYSSIPGESLYQRCHLIASQLGGAEIFENMVTGTEYMNVSGMLPIENKVADYIKRTGNHVRYEVYPYYEGNNLVCSGVLIIAQSIEDDALRIQTYCHNVQPGITIDYATGKSSLGEQTVTRSYIQPTSEPQPGAAQSYVLNLNRHRFHLPTCSSVNDIKPGNRKDVVATRDELINQGYNPCGKCNP